MFSNTTIRFIFNIRNKMPVNLEKKLKSWEIISKNIERSFSVIKLVIVAKISILMKLKINKNACISEEQCVIILKNF